MDYLERVCFASSSDRFVRAQLLSLNQLALLHSQGIQEMHFFLLYQCLLKVLTRTLFYRVQKSQRIQANKNYKKLKE